MRDVDAPQPKISQFRDLTNLIGPAKPGTASGRAFPEVRGCTQHPWKDSATQSSEWKHPW